MKYPWLDLSRELQSIAQAGLTYTENKYDKERYEQLLAMSQKILADFTDLEYEKIEKVFKMEEGYLTPKVDIRGVVVREEKILMVKETIDNCWSLPGGWADVGYTPKEIAEKEVFEESGLTVKAGRLLAVLDKKCHNHPPDVNYVYKIFIHCEEIEGMINPGLETSDVGFFSLYELPELSTPRNTREQIEMAFKKIKEKDFTCELD